MADAETTGIAWATDAMMASYDRLEVANNNLANVSSRDFHTVLVKIVATPNGLASVHSTASDEHNQRETGRKLDLAIDGPGQFRVADPANGNVVTESRFGAFSTDRDGYLVDPSNRRVLGDKGPIKVGADATVRGDGSIIDDGKVVGRIPLPAGSQMRSGYLEQSSSDSATAMLHLIDASRQYETASKAESAIDATRQKLANEVARLKS